MESIALYFCWHEFADYHEHMAHTNTSAFRNSWLYAPIHIIMPAMARCCPATFFRNVTHVRSCLAGRTLWITAQSVVPPALTSLNYCSCTALPALPTLHQTHTYSSSAVFALYPISVLTSGTTSPKMLDTLLLSLSSKTDSRRFSEHFSWVMLSFTTGVCTVFVCVCVCVSVCVCVCVCVCVHSCLCLYNVV